MWSAGSTLHRLQRAGSHRDLERTSYRQRLAVGRQRQIPVADEAQRLERPVLHRRPIQVAPCQQQPQQHAQRALPAEAAPQQQIDPASSMRTCSTAGMPLP